MSVVERETFDRGDVIWHPGLFKTSGRPWLVLSTANHPFHGEEYLVVGITTTPRPAAIELSTTAWELGGLPKDSYSSGCSGLLQMRVDSTTLVIITNEPVDVANLNTEIQRWTQTGASQSRLGDGSLRHQPENTTVEILITPRSVCWVMSSTPGWENKTEDEVQKNIDQAVEDALNFDFATFDEVKKAFEK